MTRCEPASPAAGRTPSVASACSSAVRTMGMTVYACDQDEAALFREIAPRLGVLPTITDAAVSEGNVGLARGNRCVSVGHKTPVTNATLLGLSEAGVTYVSTRSVGHNHIDVSFAASVGISVETVAYSPDSVADYTYAGIASGIERGYVRAGPRSPQGGRDARAGFASRLGRASRAKSSQSRRDLL
jgi:D-specific alpha-keto acid dehydrogenase